MKKILIIEDDPITANLYRTRLEKEGYEVGIAGDAERGFDRLVEWEPDGLLLDLMLPRTSGVELLKTIRGSESFQDLPVVVFTNAYVPNLVEDAVKAGATRVLDKSVLTPSMLAEAFRLAIHIPA